MALADIIRSVVAVGDGVTKSLKEDVQHRTWTGSDFMGASTFVTVPRKAIVEQKLQQRRFSDGTMVTVQAKLTFLEPVPPNGAAGRVEPIDPRDEFVLADGSTGPTFTDGGLRDPGVGPFLLEVWMGVRQ